MKRKANKCVMIVTVILVASLVGCSVLSVESTHRQNLETEETINETSQNEEDTSIITAEEERIRRPVEVEDIVAVEGLGHVYDMDVELDVAARTIGGTVVVDVYNDSSEPWETLCFRDYPSVYTSADMLGEYEQDVIGIEGAMTEIIEKDGDQIWVFEAICARDFTMVCGPNFSVLSDVVDGIIVNAYYMDDDIVFGEQMLLKM